MPEVHRWWGAERDRWDVGDIVRELGDQDSDIILPPRVSFSSGFPS